MSFVHQKNQFDLDHLEQKMDFVNDENNWIDFDQD